MGAIHQTTFTNNMAKEIMLNALWLSCTHGRFLTSLDYGLSAAAEILA